MHSVIGPLVDLGENVYIGHFCSIGQPDNPDCERRQGFLPTRIGDGVSIGNGCTISEDVTIGAGVRIGNGVVIRSNTVIGDGCLIGHGVVFEGDNWIGADTRIGNKSILTRGVKIGDRVFIGAHLIGANDPECRRRKHMPGSPPFVPLPYEIGSDVRIGVGVIILPGVKVGDGALLGAGSVVTKDVAAGTQVMGSPARFVKNLMEAAKP